MVVIRIGKTPNCAQKNLLNTEFITWTAEQVVVCGDYKTVIA